MSPVVKRTTTQTLPKKRLRSNSKLNNNMASISSSTATTTTTDNRSTTIASTSGSTTSNQNQHCHRYQVASRSARLFLKKRVFDVSLNVLKKQGAEIKKSLSRNRLDYNSDTDRPIVRKTRLQAKKENERIARLGKDYEKIREKVVQYYLDLDEESDENINSDELQKELWDNNFISPINPMIKEFFTLKNELKEVKKSNDDFRSTIGRIENENNEHEIFYNKFEDIFQELNCSICKEPCIDVTVSACGHFFCKFCLERWRNDYIMNIRCPVCRENIWRTNRVFGFDSLISKAISIMPNTVQDTRTQQIQDRAVHIIDEPERLARLRAEREAQRQRWSNFMNSL